MQATLPLIETDAQPPLRVLLSGASGLIGQEVLKRFLAAGENIDVIAPTRAPLSVVSPRLRNPVFGKSPSRNGNSGIQRQLAGVAVDVWVCCLGSTMAKAGSQAAFVAVDRDLVLRFSSIARAAGARHGILVSAVGASLKSGSFYLRTKAEAERGLAEQNFPRVDILRPGLLIGERTEARTLEAWAQRLVPLWHPLMQGPLQRYRAIPAGMVADAAVRLARAGGTGWFVHEYPSLRKLAES